MIDKPDDLTLLSDASAEVALAEAAEADKDYWCSDGNVVIVAGGVKFRVYMSLLTFHSQVFDDLFSISHPPISSPSTLAGCHIVVLSDSAVDVRHLLQVILPTTPLLPVTYSYDMLYACIHLGHKYQIDGLAQRAVDILEEHFTDFDKWKASSVPAPFEPIHVIGVVNLARFLDAPSILPSALLACCTMPGRDLLRGFIREDGTREKLNDDDLALVLDSKPRVMQAVAAATLRLFTATIPSECGCVWGPNPDLCHQAAQLALGKLLEGGRLELITSCHPFRSWEEFTGSFKNNPREWEVELCEECVKARADFLEAEQRKLWALLPSLFELDICGWGQ